MSSGDGETKLDIWITNEGDPCGASMFPADEPGLVWQVGIWECSGKILQWCGRTYLGLPAPCGHLVVPVPPGRYIVQAAVAYHVITPGSSGNDWTDHGVVTVCCGETACVTLFSPTAHNCHAAEQRVLELLAENGAEEVREAASAALPHIRRIAQAMQPTPFEGNHISGMLELQRLAESVKANPPEDERG